MPGKKQDARVRYTKMVVKSSLLELMQTKPVAKITVTEICEKAGINRATFYSHYSDPTDLLHSIEPVSYTHLPRVSSAWSAPPEWTIPPWLPSSG